MQTQSAPTSVRFTINLLGPYEVVLDGKVLQPRHSRKEQWLLALLCLRLGKVVEREWLADMLWPDSPQNRVLLRDTLYDLRKSLGHEASRLSSPGKQTLQFDISGDIADVHAFDSALLQGDISSLNKAVDLYKGSLLEGCSEEWVYPERHTREQSYLSALESLADHAAAEGLSAVAVGYLQRVIAVDGVRESAYCRLMGVLAEKGDSGAVVQIYRDLRNRLHREINSEPSSSTIEVFHRLRGGDRNRSQKYLRDRLDHHRTTVTPNASHNLSSPITSFIGRSKEMAEVPFLLAESRLLTLTGSGGCGKTRLCQQVAFEVLNDYREGVWLVELATVLDGNLVARAVADELGLREEANKPILKTLLEFLVTRNVLLILDNCEHLLEACSSLAQTLITNCLQLQILTTSREPLGISGEQVYRVPSLSVPSSELLAHASSRAQLDAASIQDLVEYEAIRLFIDRARAVYPAFKLKSANAIAVAQVCIRVDGIPLALELAAVRIRTLSIDEINSRLDDRFRLLTGGSRTALRRQQTLKALIDWSYDLLVDREKILLARLSVFVGGWTLEAAEAVCGGDKAIGNRQSAVGTAPDETLLPTAYYLLPPDVLDLLTSLVDKSMVIYTPNDSTPGRYRLLETIREYACERLVENGEYDALRVRHRHHFLAVALQSEPNLANENQVNCLARLTEEHDNLKAALASCNDDPEAGENYQMLAASLERFWIIRGHWSVGRTFLGNALKRTASQITRAKALLSAARLAWYQGDFDAAKNHGEESLQLARELDVAGVIAGALGNLSLVANSMGDVIAARPLLEESLHYARKLNDTRTVANILGNLGVFAHNQGEFAVARTYRDESLLLFRKSGNKRGIAFILGCDAESAYQLGNYALALNSFEESLAMRIELGDNWGAAVSMYGLGCVALSMQNYNAAQDHFGKSLQLRKELGDKNGIALSLNSMAIVALWKGDYPNAKTLLSDGLQQFKAIGNNRGVAEALEKLASVMLEQSRAVAAVQLYGTAWTLRNSTDMQLIPLEQPEYDRSVAEARELLSYDSFLEAWEIGVEMTAEQAIEICFQAQA